MDHPADTSGSKRTMAASMVLGADVTDALAQLETAETTMVWGNHACFNPRGLRRVG